MDPILNAALQAQGQQRGQPVIMGPINDTQVICLIAAQVFPAVFATADDPAKEAVNVAIDILAEAVVQAGPNFIGIGQRIEQKKREYLENQ